MAPTLKNTPAFGKDQLYKLSVGRTGVSHAIFVGSFSTGMPESKPTKVAPSNDALRAAATQEVAEVLQGLSCSQSGLSEEEAAARLERYGPNQVAREKQANWVVRLY